LFILFFDFRIKGKGKIDEIPPAFKQNEFSSAYEARYNQTDEAGIDGINYKNAVPDFLPVAKEELEIDHMLGGTGTRGEDARRANFKQADIKLAVQLNNSLSWLVKFGLTPGKLKRERLQIIVKN
jgi:hypothetical protein